MVDAPATPPADAPATPPTAPPAAPPASPPAAPPATPPAGDPTASDPTATPPAADPPAAASPDWRASITDPDAVEFAKRVASPADAVKIALDLRKANSAMIKVPGKDATPEDKAKFNKAIGVPETVEGYTFDLGREATDADKAIQGELAKVALTAGIPATAMTALSKAVTDLANAQKDEQNRVAVAARETSEAALRKEWGSDYEANKVLASRAVQAFGEIKSHPEVVEFFERTLVNGQKLGDHPVMVRMLGNIGRRMGEGDFIGAVGGNERQTLQEELATIRRDNPVGTPKYAQPAIQKRINEIQEALHGRGTAVGQGRTS